MGLFSKAQLGPVKGTKLVNFNNFYLKFFDREDVRQCLFMFRAVSRRGKIFESRHVGRLVRHWFNH